MLRFWSLTSKLLNGWKLHTQCWSFIFRLSSRLTLFAFSAHFCLVYCSPWAFHAIHFDFSSLHPFIINLNLHFDSGSKRKQHDSIISFSSFRTATISTKTKINFQLSVEMINLRDYIAGDLSLFNKTESSEARSSQQHNSNVLCTSIKCDQSIFNAIFPMQCQLVGA